MKRFLPALLLGLCAILFGATFLFLLTWRFAMGDVYPPYSSLRSDPLGTMALYESLQRIPGLDVSRDHQKANRLPTGHGTTYLHLAANPRDWRMLSGETLHTIEQFLAEGGRLVVMFAPQDITPKKNMKKEKKKADKKATPSPSPDAKDRLVSLADHWGLTLASRKSDSATHQVRNVSGLPLPGELPWHGSIVLEKLSSPWKTIYAEGEDAVMAVRSFGPGTLIVATDAYLTSNEAMLQDRYPSFLAWLVGPNHRVVFDEAHFGIIDAPGIAALARKYRLQGVFGALLVLAFLFIWKNIPPPIPSVRAAQTVEDTVTGRDSTAGFTGLLRRNIARDKIFDVCLAEWNKAFSRGTRYSNREKSAVSAAAAEEQSLPAREQDPVSAYQRICAALHRGKTSRQTVT